MEGVHCDRVTKENVKKYLVGWKDIKQDTP